MKTALYKQIFNPNMLLLKNKKQIIQNFFQKFIAYLQKRCTFADANRQSLERDVAQPG